MQESGTTKDQQACCDECARAERAAQPVTLNLSSVARNKSGKPPVSPSSGLVTPPAAGAAQPHHPAQDPSPGRSGRYPVTPWSAQRLYRPFVRWALIIGLTLGSATGAGMLLGRAFGLETGLWWLTHAQSHAVAQVFGFAGLFTMGIAFHVVPRFRNGTTIFPWPQRAALWLTVIGVTLRMAGQSIEDATPVSSPLLVLSGISVLAGVLTFAGTTAYTLTTGKSERNPAEWWVATGAAWAVVAAALHLATTVRMAVDSTIIAYGPWERVIIVAGLQGFILSFIFAVSLRAVRGFLGLRPLVTPLERAGFVALNTGVAWTVTSELTGADAGIAAWGAVLAVAGVALFIVSLRVLEPSASPRPPMPGAYPRYAWFIRSAYIWLTVFAVFYCLQALETITGASLLPAGASSPVTHVLTLGFITAMIMGMGARMLPLFEGSVINRHRALDAAWLMLMASVALRLSFGYLRPGADAVLGISGTLGLLALVLFTWAAWGALSEKAREEYRRAAQQIGQAHWRPTP